MNDVISRQALRDAMYHEAFETDTEMQRWDSGCWIRYKLFENVIDHLPSVQKQGKWIWAVDRDDERIYHLQCSVCHGVGYSEEHNFCPNCGARMINDQEV